MIELINLLQLKKIKLDDLSDDYEKYRDHTHQIFDKIDLYDDN